MAHKLSIVYKWDDSSKFRGLITPTDIVRGELANIIIAINNFGDITFPGGKMKLRINFGSQPSATIIWPQEWDCPQIDSHEIKEVLKTGFTPMIEGVGWIYLTVIASDGQLVEYYANEKEKIIDQSSWLGCFYVVNREILQLIHVNAKT